MTDCCDPSRGIWHDLIGLLVAKVASSEFIVREIFNLRGDLVAVRDLAAANLPKKFGSLTQLPLSVHVNRLS
jgi:hypothetical protein